MGVARGDAMAMFKRRRNPHGPVASPRRNPVIKKSDPMWEKGCGEKESERKLRARQPPHGFPLGRGSTAPKPAPGR